MFAIIVYRYVQSNHFLKTPELSFYEFYQISKKKKKKKKKILVQTFTLKKIKPSDEIKNHMKLHKIAGKIAHGRLFLAKSLYLIFPASPMV